MVNPGGPLGLNFFAISFIFSGNCFLIKKKKKNPELSESLTAWWLESIAEPFIYASLP